MNSAATRWAVSPRTESGGSDSSFERGLRVLSSVADNGSIRAGSIAEELELPLSTVYRYLRTLRDYALVEEHGGYYVTGWRLSEISRHDVSRTRVLELGHAFLQEIAAATGETSTLTVRVGTNAVCLRQVEPASEERVAFRLDQLLPLYAGIAQRVLLAHAPQSVIDHVLGERVRTLTERTLPPSTLASELIRIRQEGWGVSRGEYIANALAVSVPVFATGDEVVCSLTVAGPQQRCGPTWIAEARRVVMSAAQRFSVLLQTGGEYRAEEAAGER